MEALSNLKLYAELQAELEQKLHQNLFRQRRINTSSATNYFAVNSRQVLSFASNDYLGLANHPLIINTIRENIDAVGVGAGGAHLISGHHLAHHQLEKQLAEFVGLPKTLLFSNGYMANLSLISTLITRHDAIFADKLNHASLNDASLLSKAKLQRYFHADFDHLAKLLASSTAKRKLIITDAVFSMDGDIANMPALLSLCDRFDAYLYIDDAHGFGVLGEQGRGILSHFKIEHPRIIYMATLGKSAGVFGAFIGANSVVIEALIQSAKPYIYTTAMPPILAIAVSKAIEIMRNETERHQHLHKLIAFFRHTLQGFSLLPSMTAIQPVLIGDSAMSVRISEALLQRGIFVPAIRPPTVPNNKARLRVSLSANHTFADLEKLAICLRELL